MSRGRHRRPTRTGTAAAAIATSGAFALAPMVMATGTAGAAAPTVPGPRHALAEENGPATAGHGDTGRATDAAAPPGAAPAAYTVRAGDTLSGIAAARGVSWRSVWESNKGGMARPDLLHPGEQLRMPTGGDPATGTATATAARPAKVTTSRPAAARSRSGEGSGEGSGRGSGGDAGEGHGAGSAAETVRGAAGRATGSAAKATGSAARATRSAAKAAGGTGGSGRKMKIWLTGYSYQDNTPAGSAEVSQPILHQDAGGTGTYADPITVAVPGKGSGIWKAGSKFYLPTVKRYVIAEDTGASPAPSGQDGHLDMWIGGKGGTKSATDSCMDKITGTGVPATFNPPANLPVISGPVWNQSCRVPG